MSLNLYNFLGAELCYNKMMTKVGHYNLIKFQLITSKIGLTFYTLVELKYQKIIMVRLKNSKTMYSYIN